MNAAALVAHRHDASVAAAQSAAHDALDRDLARTAMSRRCLRCRREHPLGPACVDHHRRSSTARYQGAVEWFDDASAFSGAAIFRRQHKLDAALPKNIQIKELGRTTRSIEQRRANAG